MPRGARASFSTAPAVAAGCGLLAVPLFVAPSAPSAAPRLRAARAGVSAAEAPGARPGVAAAGLAGAAGLGIAGAASAALAQRRGRAAQAARAAFDPTKQLGVQAPVQFWDPAGFCSDGNEALFKRRRAVEIKHGRVSMLACMGFIVPEYFRFPGYLSPSEDLKFADVPNGLAALSKVPALGWLQILLFAGVLEGSGLQRFGTSKGTATIGWQKDASQEAEPGNYGLGNLGACGLLGSVKDPNIRAQKLNAEIANGRLAMFAIMALLFQNGVTGSTGAELYGFGENSATIYAQVVLPALAAFAFAGETFRRGPDEKFRKYFPRKDYFGKDLRI